MELRDWLLSRLDDPVWSTHARLRLAVLDGAMPPPPATPPPVLTFTRYAGPLPTCLYASRGLDGSCNPVRCWAYRGSSCGGSHASPDHCQRCLYPRPE